MKVSAKDLHDMLVDPQELAVLDVREEADFGRCHLLLAVNVPMSAMEIRISALLPRAQVRIVVCDGDGGPLGQRGAARLREIGYSDVRVLEGGTEAWQAAGFQVYSGVNVASKAFGEFIEHACDTPAISADELKRRMDSGVDMVIVDSRPLTEYQAMNIPGSICVPGGELVYRMAAVAPDPKTQVVVNCAGRTRSIIGAQSLINAGIANEVVALRNGTMGWHLAGFELERGQTRYLAELDAGTTRTATQLAEAVATRYGIESVDVDTVGEWQRDTTRTTYLLDVRTPEEFQRGRLAGSRSAPGGQLIQATDRYVGVLRSRVVLADDDGVRAVMTASWLKQMGLQQVHVLRDKLSDLALIQESASLEIPGLTRTDVPMITAPELDAAFKQHKLLLLDLSPSPEFRAGHISGARHAVRTRLAERARDVGEYALLVLSCGDGIRSLLAAQEAAQLGATQLRVLDGGNRGWQQAGFTLHEGRDGLEESPCDTFLRPYDHDRSIEQHMQSYLDWEIELVERVKKDDTVSFVTSV